MVSESSFSFASYNRPPCQCAGGTHPTGMHSCYRLCCKILVEYFSDNVSIEIVLYCRLMGGPTTEPQLLPSLVVDDTTVTVATTTGNNTDVDSEYSRQSLGETCEVQIELYRR